MTSFTVQTNGREETVVITSRVEDCVRSAGVGNGICSVSLPHTTAGVVVNEVSDPAVAEDMVCHLRRLVPGDLSYAHGEGNSDAHIKAMLIGNAVVVPVVGGKLQLGSWQGILLCEFDGPRRRQVRVMVK